MIKKIAIAAIAALCIAGAGVAHAEETSPEPTETPWPEAMQSEMIDALEKELPDHIPSEPVFEDIFQDGLDTPLPTEEPGLEDRADEMLEDLEKEMQAIEDRAGVEPGLEDRADEMLADLEEEMKVIEDRIAPTTETVRPSLPKTGV